MCIKCLFEIFLFQIRSVLTTTILLLLAMTLFNILKLSVFFYMLTFYLSSYPFLLSPSPHKEKWLEVFRSVTTACIPNKACMRDELVWGWWSLCGVVHIFMNRQPVVSSTLFLRFFPFLSKFYTPLSVLRIPYNKKWKANKNSSAYARIFIYEMRVASYFCEFLGLEKKGANVLGKYNIIFFCSP